MTDYGFVGFAGIDAMCCPMALWRKARQIRVFAATSQPPARRLALPAHQHGPELPADRLFAVAEKVANLEGLLQLLEKHLDAPPRLIEFADAGGGPLGELGEE